MLPGFAHTPALPVVATLSLQPPRCALIVHPPIFPYSLCLFLFSFLLLTLVVSHYLAVGYSRILAVSGGMRPSYGLICGRSRARGSPCTPVYPTPIGRGYRVKFFFITPEEDAKCRAHQGHEAVCLRSIGPPFLPHLPFFYPAVCASSVIRYTRCGSVGRTVKRDRVSRTRLVRGSSSRAKL